MTSADLRTLQMPTVTEPRRRAGLLRSTGYCLAAFPVVLVAFVVVVTGLSVGLSLLVVAVGIPVLAATAYLARGLAHLERGRMRSLLGRPAPSPAYEQPPPGGSVWARWWAPLRDPQSWLDMLWSIVGFITGCTAFCVVVAWWAAIGSGFTYWFWQRWLPIHAHSHDTLAYRIGMGDGRTPEIWLNLGFGAFALVTLPIVCWLMAAMHAGTSAALLCSRAELQAQVRRAEGGREAARRAEATSLRRLERDIHDGPQQRLVRLQMDLGRARQQLDRDPATARETIDEAMRQARDTVQELRSLSRGIAPPILVDRGLEAALNEAFARSPLPVYGDLHVPAELPAHTEATVYFIVAEALTNVAKHASASRVDVRLAEAGDRLVIEVTDDGVGGADLGKGHGLAGLAERARGADGTLGVTSPAGGPTTVRAEIARG